MSASTVRARARRFARAGLVAAMLLVAVVGLVPAGAVRAGAAVDHRTADSAPPGRIVTAWGSNAYGQTRVPAGLRRVTAIAAGAYFNLALRSDGTVAAWGVDGDGQTRVPAGLTGVTAIAAGGGHSLALRVDGTVVAWGDNYWGQAPAGLRGFTAIAAGPSHSLARCARMAPSRPSGTTVMGRTRCRPGCEG